MAKESGQRRNPCILAILLLAAAYGVYASWNSLMSSAWDSALILLVLAGIMAWRCLKQKICWEKYRNLRSELCVSYAILAFTLFLAFCKWDILSAPWRFSILLLGILMATGVYFCSWKATLLAFTPAAIFTCIVPQQEQLFLLMSAPLRRIAAVASTAILRMMGFTIFCDHTSIHLPDVELAITDACSGIQQFEAMLLLGYLLTIYLHKDKRWACLHYLFIVPSVIAANILRLVLVVLLYHCIGIPALETGWHEALGYVQVALMLLIFYAIGYAVKFLASDEKQETPSPKKAK